MASDPSPKGPQKAVRVGKYEVVAHIATGGMGAVYRARDPESGLDVALKVLTPEMAAKPAMLERFRREARSAAKLHHENIVRLFEFDDNGRDRLCIDASARSAHIDNRQCNRRK